MVTVPSVQSASPLQPEKIESALAVGVSVTTVPPIRSGAPTDQAEVDDFRDQNFPGAFDYLESVAPDDGGLIKGQFGITDISLAAPVRLLDLAGAPLNAERWPRFEAYYRRTINRPSAQSIYEEELSADEVFLTTGDAPS